MFVIGLTGGIGSGKSTVANLFATHGIHIVDADLVARACVAPGSKALDAIAKRFGHQVLTSDGTLDRSQLRDRIFHHETDRAWLEDLLHQAIRQRMQAEIRQATSSYTMAVIPLLVENEVTEYIHRICVVDLDEALQRQRASQRDDCDEAMIQSIIDVQATRQERLALADDVIHNDKDMNHLTAQVNQLHQRYLDLAKQQA